MSTALILCAGRTGRTEAIAESIAQGNRQENGWRIEQVPKFRAESDSKIPPFPPLIKEG